MHRRVKPYPRIRQLKSVRASVSEAAQGSLLTPILCGKRVGGIRAEGATFPYGHLAEGNFRVNVVGCPDPDALVEEVLRLVVSLGGAVASEHGIGVAKGDWWRHHESVHDRTGASGQGVLGPRRDPKPGCLLG
jgi:hypothetical protein